MDELHVKSISEKNFEPKKGQRDLMCSNKESPRCPFLGSLSEEDQALECLSDILVESFIKKKKDEYNKLKQKEGGDLLSSLNKRTG